MGTPVLELVQRANGSNNNDDDNDDDNDDNNNNNTDNDDDDNNNDNNNKEEEEKKPEYRKNRLTKIHTLLKGVNELRPILSRFLYRFGSKSAQDISNQCI